MSNIKFTRVWAMPSVDTFSIAPIGDLVKQYLRESKISVDPFARNFGGATYTNDLNPDTSAQYHLEALEFLIMLRDVGVQCDFAIFDPPYSPRQISESYAQVGRVTTMQDTQAISWTNWRDALNEICLPDAIVISCGWNTNGMGIKRGYEIVEILAVCHGGGHNDTLVTVERKIAHQIDMFSIEAAYETQNH